MNTVNLGGVGLIGLGEISPYWLEAIFCHPEVHLVAVCDSNTKLQNNVPDVPFFSDLECFLALEKLHCVVVCTPPNSHKEIITKALNKGKAVIVEKPLTTALDSGLECLQLAKTLKTPVYLAYHSVFGPMYQTAKMEILKLMETDKLSKIITDCREDANENLFPNHWCFDPVRSGGGCLINNGINQLSLICDLIGEVKTKNCFFEMKGSRVESTVEAEFESLNGVKVFLKNSWAPSDEPHMAKFVFQFESNSTVEFDFCQPKIKLITKKKEKEESENEKIEENEIKEIEIENRENTDKKQVPMTKEYINMMKDAIQFLSNSNQKEIYVSENSLFPFQAVMECYQNYLPKN